MLKKKKRKYKLTKSEWACIIVLCAPAVLHLLVFWLGTQLETIRMMFTHHSTGELTLDNFKWAFTQLFADVSGSDVALAFRNTMFFFLKEILLVPVTMFFSYLIFRKCFGHSFTRLALYLPAAVSSIMMCLIYIKIMESTSPFMLAVQNFLGLDTPIFLKVEHGIAYIMIYDVFAGVGANLIMWLGGMNRIPKDLIEYGKLEGIGPFREFASVVLPLIWPTFVTMVTLQLIGIFGASGSVLTLTNGEFNTYTLSFWMYKMVEAGYVNEYNHVAALGMIFTIVSVPLVVLGRKFMNRFGEEVEY